MQILRYRAGHDITSLGLKCFKARLIDPTTDLKVWSRTNLCYMADRTEPVSPGACFRAVSFWWSAGLSCKDRISKCPIEKQEAEKFTDRALCRRASMSR